MYHRLVVELRDKHRLLVARDRLPYQFTSVPKKKNAPSQYMSGQQNTSPHLQNMPCNPSLPTSPAVPGSEHHPHGYSDPPQRHHPEYQDAQHATNHSSATLERLAPTEGPVLGGLTILLSGTNFPSPPECIYAKFGSLVTPTVWFNRRFCIGLRN